MIKFKFTFTLSKIAGLFIILSGVIYGFIFHNREIMIGLVYAGAFLLGHKNHTQKEIIKFNGGLK